MKLEGIHHITAITADAPRNVTFYAGTLGLRLVKKSVNQDMPTIYHLFYADEKGDPGSDITFFEFPDAAPGRPGAGMVHTIYWRVASGAALDFWEERLATHDVKTTRTEDGGLRFDDPEGLTHEFLISDVPDEPLRARHPEIPEDYALLGFDGVRAYTRDPAASGDLLGETLNFASDGEGAWSTRGEKRGSYYLYDEAPAAPGIEGAGSVHHVAWGSPIDEHQAWRDRVAQGGMQVTPIIDRYYFKSIYFREPSGVLFEIATIGPGFDVDEPIEHLGESLALPPKFEQLRSELEKRLTPLPNPRAGAAEG